MVLLHFLLRHLADSMIMERTKFKKGPGWGEAGFYFHARFGFLNIDAANIR